MDYKQQAIDFCEKHGVKVEIKRRGFDSKPEWGTSEVATYDVKISRGKESYTFTFYNSIYSTEILKFLEKGEGWVGGKWLSRYQLGITKLSSMRKEATPNPYDILSCLTKYDPGSHKDFCSAFGYDEDSIKGLETYKAVMEEYLNVARVLGDCIEESQEIQ